jgi:hypothetical protein
MKTQFYQIAHQFHDSQSIIMEEIKYCLHRVGVNQFGVTSGCHTEFHSIGTGSPFSGTIKRIGQDKHQLVIKTNFEPFAMDLGHEIKRVIEQKKLQMVNKYHQNTFAMFQEMHFPDLLLDIHFIGIQKSSKKKVYKCTVHTNKMVDTFSGTFKQMHRFLDLLNADAYSNQKIAKFDHDKLILN